MSGIIDVEWMQKVLQSQVIIRGKVEDGELDRFRTTIQILYAHPKSFTDGKPGMRFASLRYASLWPMRTSQLYLPNLLCEVVTPEMYVQRLGVISHTWKFDDKRYLRREQTILIDENQSFQQLLFTLHLGRLSALLQVMYKWNGEEDACAVMSDMIYRLEAVASARCFSRLRERAQS